MGEVRGVDLMAYSSLDLNGSLQVGKQKHIIILYIRYRNHVLVL